MDRNINNFFLKYYAAAVPLLVFTVYLITLAPGVVQIDSGELAAVQISLGIAHPTGYPLFTLIGHLFSLIPFPFTKIYQMNLLSAVWCALGIYLFILSAQIIFKNLSNRPSENKKRRAKTDLRTSADDSDEKSGFIAAFSITAGSIVLAFSETFWFQSTSVEVYSLQIFLFMLNIYLILRGYFSAAADTGWWIITAVSLALGFANHMTTLLLLPFIAVLFFHKEKSGIRRIKLISLMLLVFIPLLFLFYLYLPFRASANPQINWGNTVNHENILRHITGKQYQVWLFASFQAAGKQLRYFISGFPAEFGYAPFFLGLPGIIAAFKKSRIIFYALAATFLFAVLYSVNYDISDIDSYFLLAYITFSFFILFGFLRTAEFLKQKLYPRVSYTTLFLFSLLPLILNYSRVNQNDTYTYEDYTKAVLGSVEKNSVIFSYQWDFFVSPSYYYQICENYRSDVCVIDKELLRRSWYYNQLRRNHPDLFVNMEQDVSNFLTAVMPFERSETFNPDLIEGYYRTLMARLIPSNAEKRNFYIGQELFQNEMQRGEFSLPEGYQIVPHLLLFKVVKGDEYVPSPDPGFKIRFSGERNKYLDSIEGFIYNMLIYRAYYELQFNKPERARVFIKKIREEFPERIIPLEISDRIK